LATLLVALAGSRLSCGWFILRPLFEVNKGFRDGQIVSLIPSYGRLADPLTRQFRRLALLSRGAIIDCRAFTLGGEVLEHHERKTAPAPVPQPEARVPVMEPAPVPQVVLSAVPPAPAEPKAEIEPDSPAAVLGIGAPDEEPVPADAATIERQTKKQPKVKKRRRMAPSKDSVLAWHKDRCLARPGRSLHSTDARADYEAFCGEHDLLPVDPATFVRVLRAECGVSGERRGGKVFYADMGLRPALRLVGEAV
jgi:hypothetical protein